MLYLTIPKLEGFDSVKEEFVTLKPATKLQLEHSLLSISKWEAKYHKPFLGKKNKTLEEVLYYVRCMTVNKSVDKSVYDRLTQKHLNAIQAYMSDSHSAYTFRKNNHPRLVPPVSEELYYSMFYYGIPKECEQWHINNLLALLDIASAKNTPVKKKTAREINQFYAELNAARRAELGTKG